MKYIKRPRESNLFAAFVSLIISLFGIFWSVMVIRNGFGFMAVFGFLFAAMGFFSFIYSIVKFFSKDNGYIYKIDDQNPGGTNENLKDGLNSDYKENTQGTEQKYNSYTVNPTEERKLCPHCGAPVSSSFKFCNNCGKKLK